MDDLVTGEAVVLGLRVAKLPSRALAKMLDLLAQLAALGGTAFLVALLLPDLDDAAGAAVALSMVIGYLVVLPVLLETLSKGRSLGKLAFGLRVVRTDGGPVRFRHALVRGLVGFLEVITFVGIPAVISSLVSPQGRRLGDVFAGTLVVRERAPRMVRAGGFIEPPAPELMRWLSGELAALDLSAVPDGLWLAIRQYLGRVEELDPAVAGGMAQRLLGDLVARTGQAAPVQVHPVAYLGAVFAERQRREWERAARPAGGPAVPLVQPQPAPAPVRAPAAEPPAGGFAPPA